jgi:hypothetical protein
VKPPHNPEDCAEGHKERYCDKELIPTGSLIAGTQRRERYADDTQEPKADKDKEDKRSR